jgi:predicted DNA-binding transcriptional regulator AlpA
MEEDFDLSAQTEPLLSSELVAQLLGCTPAALQLWRREKRGPTYVRLGRLIRYRSKDINSWVESQTVQLGQPQM